MILSGALSPRASRGINFYLVTALVFEGCSASATFEGIGFDEAWEIATETVSERATALETDPRAGILRARAHHIRSSQERVESIVDPHLPSSTLVSQEVTVEIIPHDEVEKVTVDVSGETVYRTFYTEFERSRNVELEEEILRLLTRNLLERIDRKALTRELARVRSAAGPGHEGMLLVPRTSFLMGEADSYRDSAPVHRVTVGPYWIDVHEVTVADYSRFVAAGGYRERAWWSEEGWRWLEDRGIAAPGGWNRVGDANPRLPVTGVSWYEAQAYSRWADRRLPSEAEWELAARGAAASVWPWSNFFRQFSNSYESELHGVVAVGAYPEGASPFGCLDMSGNAAEWCADWYHPHAYEESPSEDPRGPASGLFKTLRGGSYESWRLELATFYRDRAEPGFQHPTIGFRCVADPEAAASRTADPD